MKVSSLIKELRKIKKREGDIEVTCTGTLSGDKFPDVYETTVENLIVREPDNIFKEKRVRLYL